jgi:hypothetical protein
MQARAGERTVLTPQRADLVLATDIPYSECHVAVVDRPVGEG